MLKHRNPLAECSILTAIVQSASTEDQPVLLASLCKLSDSDWQAWEKAIELYCKTKRGKKL